MKILFFLSFLFSIQLAIPSLGLTSLRAQDEESGGEKAKTAPAKDLPAQKPAITKNKVTIGGREIAYTARVDTLKLLKADGKARASVFYIAYTKDGTKDPADRPVTFCFNGGPGSSSVWLHLGAFGPRRVVLGDGVNAPRPPYQLTDNEWSLLDVTDLVFIDPVSTGFSRPEQGEKASDFHGFQEDLSSVGDFIQRYVSENERWASPKFLAGESYGAVRASGLSNQLQSRYGMYLNGTILVSGLLDFKTISFDDQNDLPYISYLPSLTASAFYHKRLSGDLQKNFGQTLKAAREYATGEYATALLKGNSLNKSESAAIAMQLARLTGLPAAKIEAANLRISPHWFRKELLRDQGEVIGRFDARNKGHDGSQAGEYPEFDPSYTTVQGVFSSGINDYLRRELKYQTTLDYVVLGGVGRWNYSSFTNQYVKVNSYLERALQANPHLQILVTCGYTDLATPFMGIEHTVNQLDLAPPLRKNITFEYYQAGHMMYTNLPDLKKLKKDISAFVAKSVGPKQGKAKQARREGEKGAKKNEKVKGRKKKKKKKKQKEERKPGEQGCGAGEGQAEPKPKPEPKKPVKEVKNLAAVEAAAYLEKHPNVVVLDIRTAKEFKQGHLKGAVNIDYYGKDFAEKLDKLDKAKTYVMHCRSGGRSARSMPTFGKLGFKDIVHIKDGYQAWVAAKKPVVKEEKK